MSVGDLLQRGQTKERIFPKLTDCAPVHLPHVCIGCSIRPFGGRGARNTVVSSQLWQHR